MKKTLTILAVISCLLIPHYAHADITTGLIGYWPLEEGVGTTAYDTSGNGNNGTLENGPSWTTGNIGPNALFFNGVNQNVTMNDIPQLNGITTATLSAWAYKGNSAQSPNFGRGGTSGGFNRFEVEWYSDGNVYMVNETGAPAFCYVPAPSSTGWHLITLVYNGAHAGNNCNAFTLYWDGVLVNPATYLGGPIPSTIYNDAGGTDYFALATDWNNTTQRFFSGILQDVRLYNRTLSQSDITQLYSYTYASPPSSGDLHGWAWSSNIGWLSFNSTDSGMGGGASYKVNMSTTTSGSNIVGTFSGYAWSPNIGWVSFNPSDLNSAPACPNGSAAAEVVIPAGGTTGTVTGFVRALSGVGSNTWDGCIQLSDNGASPLYFDSPHTLGDRGVTFQTQTSSSGTNGLFNGFAWDSGALGWLNFSPETDADVWVPYNESNLNSSLSVSCSNNSSGNPNVSFNAVASGTAPYTYTWIFGDGSASQNTASPSHTYVQQSTSQTYYPTVSVSDSAGNVSSGNSCGSFTIAGTNNPTTSGLKVLIASGSRAPSAWSNSFPSGYTIATVKKGQPFILGWDINLTSDYSCSASSNATWPSWGGGVPANANGSYQSGNSGSLNTSSANPGPYTFTVSCVSLSNPTVSGSATLNVTNSSEGEI